MHTVVAADPNGVPIRVACGYCSSEHNYRGGPRTHVPPERGAQRPSESAPRAPSQGPTPGRSGSKAPRADRQPFPIVSERERTGPAMAADQTDIEMLLRRVIREESGVTAV